VCLTVAVFTLAAAAQAADNSVKGSLTVDGQPVKLTHVYAYARPGFFDKKKRDVVVLICDGPVVAKAVRDVFELKKLTDAGKLRCVSQIINTERQVINYEVMHSRFGMQESGGSTYHVFEAKTFDAATIGGRSRTTSTQKSFRDVPYSYDVTFMAAIEPMPNKKVGKKLPSGGGALGEAYLAKVKRTLSMDIADIRKSAPPGELDNTSDEELKAMLQLAVALTPKDQKITNGYENGDQGTLFVTGMLGQEKRYGIIEMEKKEGEWMVVEESWSDTPPE
jgi:hypothetical protein